TQETQVNTADKMPLDNKVTVGKLENGLTYYIRPNSRPEKKVELRLVVNTGSVLEDDSQQGLAHMAEHMAFNGTKNYKKNEIVSFLQSIGVGFGNDLNARTGFNETIYILPIPTDKAGNLEKGFDILEDWAHNVTYLDEDIDSERAVILEERRLGKGASDRMYRQIFPKLFAGSKYGDRLPIGQEDIIKNFKYDEIRRFYKDWYRPDLMAVIVVGDITKEKAEELVKKHFSALSNPANSRPRVDVEMPPYTTSSATVVTDKEATSYQLVINYPAFKAPPTSTVGDYRKDLVQSLFTTLMNQRLQEITQKENPPFLFAGVDFDSYARGYDQFNAYAGTGTGDIQKGLSALTEEIERVKRFGFTAPELERAKKSMQANYERAWNNRDKTESSNYVDEYVNHYLEQEPTPGIDKEFEYVKALLPGIKLEEVNAVTSAFKDEKNKFVYTMGPEPRADQKLPTDSELLAVIDNTSRLELKPYEEKAVAADLLKTIPKAGKILSTTKDALLGTTDMKLSNGVTVTLKPTDFKNDQILMAATRPGGKNNYGIKDKYNAEYAVPVVSAMGVGEFSPTDLKKAMAGKTVTVSPNFGPVTDGLRGSSSVKDLETMFQLTNLYLTQPRKDTALFRAYVQRNKSQFAQLGSNPQAAFIDTMYKVLYANNELAPVAVPKSSYFDKIDLDRSLAIYKERFGDVTGMHFVFVGSFKEAEIKPLIEKYIASLPVTGKKFSFIDNKVRPVSGTKKLNFNKGKEQKSLILAIYSGEIPYSEELDLKLQAMSEVLNIRIIEELREKVQGIYGGGSFAALEKAPYSNYSFMLQLPCGPEKVDTLLKAVNNEFRQIADKGPEQSYLDKVKQQWKEQYRTSMKENGTWISNLVELKEKKGDPKRFVDYESFVDKLTIKDVQQAAKLVFDGKNQFVAVLMPEDAAPKAEEKKKAF
ncbi:MAG: insulinase family protein, partial [Chitinophagaceae bacterium]